LALMEGLKVSLAASWSSFSFFRFSTLASTYSHIHHQHQHQSQAASHTRTQQRPDQTPAPRISPSTSNHNPLPLSIPTHLSIFSNGITLAWYSMARSAKLVPACAALSLGLEGARPVTGLNVHSFAKASSR
jgi:hypothetical protein